MASLVEARSWAYSSLKYVPISSREIARSYEESILAIYQQVGEIQIISRAFPPEEKSGPLLEINILLGLLAGLFVSIMVVFYREYLKD